MDTCVRPAWDGYNTKYNVNTAGFQQVRGTNRRLMDVDPSTSNPRPPTSPVSQSVKPVIQSVSPRESHLEHLPSLGTARVGADTAKRRVASQGTHIAAFAACKLRKDVPDGRWLSRIAWCVSGERTLFSLGPWQNRTLTASSSRRDGGRCAVRNGRLFKEI